MVCLFPDLAVKIVRKNEGWRVGVSPSSWWHLLFYNIYIFDLRMVKSWSFWKLNISFQNTVNNNNLGLTSGDKKYILTRGEK